MSLKGWPFIPDDIVEREIELDRDIEEQDIADAANRIQKWGPFKEMYVITSARTIHRIQEKLGPRPDNHELLIVTQHGNVRIDHHRMVREDYAYLIGMGDNKNQIIHIHFLPTTA
jgi:hypothetical protein